MLNKLPFNLYFQVLLHGVSDPKAEGQKATEKAKALKLPASLPLLSESQTPHQLQSQQKQPPGFVTAASIYFPKLSEARRNLNKHTSVIQSQVGVQCENLYLW